MDSWRPGLFRAYCWLPFLLLTGGLAAGAAAAPQKEEQPATQTSINGPTALALYNDRYLYVIEGEEDRVRRIDLTSGTISTVAGTRIEDDCVHKDGIQATRACLDSPASLAVDSLGNLFIGEIAGYVRKVDVSTGVISTVAGDGQPGETAEGAPALSAHFWAIDGLAMSANDDLFIADDHQEKIFKLDAKTGLVSSVAGDGRQGFAGDGGLAVNASFRFFGSIALDKPGNLIIADHDNCRIRRIDRATGIINTIAVTGESNPDGSCKEGDLGPGPSPSDPATDSSGNIYFVEGAMDIVRRIDGGALTLSTFVGNGAKGYGGDGGLAARAQLNNPSALAVDAEGNLFIAEYVNNRIRRVDARTKIITTVAGNGLPHRIDVQM